MVKFSFSYVRRWDSDPAPADVCQRCQAPLVRPQHPGTALGIEGYYCNTLFPVLSLSINSVKTFSSPPPPRLTRQVMAAVAQLVITMAGKGYLVLEGGHFLVEFIIDLCSISQGKGGGRLSYGQKKTAKITLFKLKGLTLQLKSSAGRTSMLRRWLNRPWNPWGRMRDLSWLRGFFLKQGVWTLWYFQLHVISPFTL